MNWKIGIAIMMIASPAFAGVSRVLDGTQITVGSPSNVLTLPATTDTVVGRATTDTLTNKTLTAPVISSISNSGTVTLPSSTDTLVGRATTDTLTNKSISGGTNTITAVPAGTALSGQVPVANGGTGSASLTANNVILGNGTSAVQFVAPGSSGNVLTSNGSSWTSAAIATAAPALNGSSATPQSVSAVTGISLSGITYSNFVWVVGNGGAVTVTATPSITACTADGQVLHVVGTSNTNTVTLQDNAGLSGSNLQLNGTWVGGLYSTLTLECNITLGMWIEQTRR